MTKKYSREEIIFLAFLAAEDYRRGCEFTTLRGKENEEALRGLKPEELAKKLGLPLEQVLGNYEELCYKEVAERNGLSVEAVKELTVDLSEKGFYELPPLWQQKNLASAEQMIELMETMGGEGLILGLDLNDPEVRVKYGTILHKVWLAQPSNSWAKDGPLDKPFNEISPDEQEKDIQQLRSLQKWLRRIRG